MSGSGAIKLSRAFVCVSCDELFEASQTCPVCGSKQVWPIANWLQKAPSEKVIRLFETCLGREHGTVWHRPGGWR